MPLKCCCFLLLSPNHFLLIFCCPCLPLLPPSRPSGTSIIQVTATDADDPTYGNSAKLVYTLVQGQQYFSVDPQTGECARAPSQRLPRSAYPSWGNRCWVEKLLALFRPPLAGPARVTGARRLCCARRASVIDCSDIRGPLRRANGGAF